MKLAPLSLSILRFEPYTEEELNRVIEERVRKKLALIKENTPKKASGRTAAREKASDREADREDKPASKKTAKKAASDSLQGAAGGKIKGEAVSQ